MPTSEWLTLSEDFRNAMWQHEEHLCGGHPPPGPDNDYERMFCAGGEL